jgi:hypothetical protein
MDPNTAPTFTILLPVVRPPAMLPFAIRSVLAQDRPDFELFIVCDGAPAETVACAETFAAEDPRVRVFAHPKGVRHGEAYRHQALQHARGHYVCHIGDDDLWLPHHLTEMARLLEDVDFGHISHFEITGSGTEIVAGGTPILLAGDLADPAIRQRMIDTEGNFFGASVGGYRLAAYRALPQGWAPGPPNRPSDLHMWLKFLNAPGLRYGTRVAVTTLKLGASTRRDWPMERRVGELEGWARRLADPLERDRLMQAALLSMSRGTYHLQHRAEDLVRQVQALTERNAHALEGQARAQAAEAQADEARAQAQAAEAEALRAQRRALAERDAIAARLNEVIAETQTLKAELAAREHQVLLWRQRSKEMRKRWSWRVTKPFRQLARLFARKPAR